MEYDIQCQSLFVENLRLPHRFDDSHILLKEYIDEEMNAHITSVPESYDYQNHVILRPIKEWILKFPPGSSASTDFYIGQSVSGVDDPFCFNVSGNHYVVTANPEHIPLSTSSVPYAFRNEAAKLLSPKHFKLSSLIVDPDITNFHIDRFSLQTDSGVRYDFYEKNTYNMTIEVSLDEPTTELLKVIVETSDTSIANISGTSVLSFHASGKNASTSVVLQTYDATDRQSTSGVYPIDTIFLRLRVITASRNCQIMQKLFPITIKDKPTLSNFKWEHHSLSGTMEDWERVFVTQNNIIRATFDSDGPMSIEPVICLEQLNISGIYVSASGTSVSGTLRNIEHNSIDVSGGNQNPTPTESYQQNYTWTYDYEINDLVQNGPIRMRIEEREWYSVE